MAVKEISNYDVIIIGAGAAGLMCAIEAGKRGRQVLVLDKAKKAAGKIFISGGGRCNFTNLNIEAPAYLTGNPHFCKSALARYTQWDFIVLMDQHQLTWQEKTLGQLFCEQKSPAVVQMLLDECQQTGVEIRLECDIRTVSQDMKRDGYQLETSVGALAATSLVVACGGPSIPAMGATDFAMQLARQFGLKTVPFRPGLVPFTFSPSDKARYFEGLSGIALEVIISCQNKQFREQMLITHRGLSGPACLQISSYWNAGDWLEINLLPDVDAVEWLLSQQQARGKAALKTILAERLPKRLAARLPGSLPDSPQADTRLGDIPQGALKVFAGQLNSWKMMPAGTEGLRTAEVCLGGVDTHELSSKTLQALKQPGLYFIGEAVDVTGWLGGYNFQWAWSSGWVAGQVV